MPLSEIQRQANVQAENQRKQRELQAALGIANTAVQGTLGGLRVHQGYQQNALARDRFQADQDWRTNTLGPLYGAQTKGLLQGIRHANELHPVELDTRKAERDLAVGSVEPRLDLLNTQGKLLSADLAFRNQGDPLRLRGMAAEATSAEAGAQVDEQSVAARIAQETAGADQAQALARSAGANAAVDERSTPSRVDKEMAIARLIGGQAASAIAAGNVDSQLVDSRVEAGSLQPEAIRSDIAATEERLALAKNQLAMAQQAQNFEQTVGLARRIKEFEDTLALQKERMANDLQLGLRGLDLEEDRNAEVRRSNQAGEELGFDRLEELRRANRFAEGLDAAKFATGTELESRGLDIKERSEANQQNALQLQLQRDDRRLELAEKRDARESAQFDAENRLSVSEPVMQPTVEALRDLGIDPSAWVQEFRRTQEIPQRAIEAKVRGQALKAIGRDPQFQGELSDDEKRNLLGIYMLEKDASDVDVARALASEIAAGISPHDTTLSPVRDTFLNIGVPIVGPIVAMGNEVQRQRMIAENEAAQAIANSLLPIYGPFQEPEKSNPFVDAMLFTFGAPFGGPFVAGQRALDRQDAEAQARYLEQAQKRASQEELIRAAETLAPRGFR